MKLRAACVVLGFLSLAQLTFAQSTAETASALPRLVRFGGTVKDLNGNPLTGVVGVTIALYSERTGGGALWLETQNVTADRNGRYVALLGSTKPDGLPADLFTSVQARWVGVQVSGQAEQPRVLLVSAPYALKAGDAETIGGLPPSAFVLAAPQTGRAATESAVTARAMSGLIPNVTGTGTTDFIPLWTNSTGKLGNSVMFQSGTGSTAKVGINTTTPAQKLEVDLGNLLVRGTGNFTAAGNTAYVYVGDTNHSIEAINASGLAIGAYKVPQAIFLQDKTGNVGIGTTTPAYTLDVHGTGNFTAATSTSLLAISATGFNAPSGSNLNGSTAINAMGGSGDPNSGTATAGVAGNFVGGGTGAGGTNANYGITVTGGYGDPGSASAGYFIGGPGRYYGGDGIDAYAGFGGGSYGYAGYFSGDLDVTGAITAGTKDFKIDHPLDPANKYLFHASVESSEMMNIYTGNVITDAQGDARVKLPEWFEAVNGDFRYQLTVIGQFAQAIVSGEVANHQFSIKTDKPNVKVSWQIAGVRLDAFAKAHPLVVEQEKGARERGHYIHPELYGASEPESIDWALHPQRQRMQENRERQQQQKTISHLPKPQATETSSK